MPQPVVIAAVRTPVARAHAEKGYFRDVRADDLSADIMRAVLDRVPFPANQVEDIHWGCVKQEREQGFNIARQAALIAGFPVETPATTVNRLCGSSLQVLINQAAQSIMAGVDDVQIAGGVEHMQHIPMEAGFDLSPRSPPQQHRHTNDGPDRREFGPQVPHRPGAEQGRIRPAQQSNGVTGDRLRRVLE